MTIYKPILTLTILTLFFGCDNYKNRKRQNEIKKIVFATGGCFGTCPIQAIDIDSSLIVKYYGVKYAEKLGFYIGKTSNGFWDTLNTKFENIKYKQLDSSYEHSVDDLSTEIYIYYNDNKVKHIYGQSSSLPDSVMLVYKWLMKSIKQTKLLPIKDTLTFPTHIEKPIPIPHFPKNFKFVPPKINNK